MFKDIYYKLFVCLKYLHTQFFVISFQNVNAFNAVQFTSNCKNLGKYIG